MKMKIIILMILILISLNNVSGNDEIGNGEFDYSETTKSEFQPIHNHPTVNSYTSIYFKDIGTIQKIKRIQMEIDIDNWAGSALDSKWYNVQFRSGGISGSVVTTGVFGFSKSTTKYYVTVFFDSDVLGSGTTILYMTTASGCQVPAIVRTNRYSSPDPSLEGSNVKSTDALIYYAYSAGYIPSDAIGKIQSNTYYDISFYNSYNWTNNISRERLRYNQIRDSGNKTKTKITIDGNIYYNDTSFQDTELNYLHPFYDSNIWNINIENEYGSSKNFDISFDVPDETQPTLITDKTTYNTNEQITISFTNLNNIENDGNSPVDLRSIIIMYPDIDKYTGYDKKYIYNLLYHEYEGSFTINTSFLSPQTDYILFACDAYDGILFEGDSFNVYPEDEYLSVSCDKDAGCITYNGIKNIFYYKINNNSDIIIKDNDNNIINTYHNIIGTGSIIYTIPDDIEHLNIYPDWKIYLNNTDYSTSYNKNMEVYWSLFVSPTETATPYPTATADINISNQLDNLTVEIQPLKDLLYGFVYIVIDNPDYDKDNIIDENEINYWFNSLIPMCLFLLLIILYIGLKKNRG